MPGILYFNFVSTVEINAGHVLLIIFCSMEHLPFAMRLPDRFPMNGFLPRQAFPFTEKYHVLLELFQLHMLLIDY